MAKLSALVIPAVIDTSGVDRGINQIKSKMSRVRGSGGIGGGISPGHSAGIVPYGVGDGFGGAGGAAMGAAFGAAIGNRNQQIASGARIGYSPNIAKLSFFERQKYQLSTSLGTVFHAIGTYAENRQTYYASKNRALREAEKGMPWRDKWMRKSNPERLMNQQGYDFWKGIRDKANIAGTTAVTMQNRLMGGSLLGDLPTGRLLPALGGLAAGAAVMRHIDPLNQQQRNAAPIAQFAGTQNYAALAEMKSRAEASKGKFMSFGQAFDVGGMKAAGPGGSTFTENLGNAYGNMRQSVGELAGASLTNPMYGAAMLAAPGSNTAVHQAMTQGMEVAVGSVVLSIENAFKKLFN